MQWGDERTKQFAHELAARRGRVIPFHQRPRIDAPLSTKQWIIKQGLDELKALGILESVRANGGRLYIKYPDGFKEARITWERGQQIIQENTSKFW